MPGFVAGTAAAGNRASRWASAHNAAAGVDGAGGYEGEAAERRAEVGTAEQTAGDVPGCDMPHKDYACQS